MPACLWPAWEVPTGYFLILTTHPLSCIERGTHTKFECHLLQSRMCWEVFENSIMSTSLTSAWQNLQGKLRSKMKRRNKNAHVFSKSNCSEKVWRKLIKRWNQRNRCYLTYFIRSPLPVEQTETVRTKLQFVQQFIFSYEGMSATLPRIIREQWLQTAGEASEKVIDDSLETNIMGACSFVTHVQQCRH